ncbi:hypothetical protein N9955_00265 [bacterium]|nr:hypothetical protein [bacterium]
MSERYYTGIGSRQTPPDILDDMNMLAAELERDGWWLRSGGAGGADEAFQSGVKEKAQIWLPWPNFAPHLKKQYPMHDYKVIGNHDEAASNHVLENHPNPKALSRGGFSLHKRNYRQVVGIKEKNSSFVICWTPDGKETGGTATAIKLAKSLGIPVFNLFDYCYFEVMHEARKINQMTL